LLKGIGNTIKNTIQHKPVPDSYTSESLPKALIRFPLKEIAPFESLSWIYLTATLGAAGYCKVLIDTSCILY
jgi:hypothetical protein